MRVAVLSGGRSSEHEVSLRSGAAVADGMREAGHEVVEVVIGRDGRWLGPDGEQLVICPGGGLLDADAAFAVIHGPYGEDGIAQGVLEALDLPYVGPGVLAAAITLDKLTCKRLLAGEGIDQVGFVEAVGEGWHERALAMGLPLWVKPSRLGSSVGIAKVTDPSELDEAVSEARDYDPRVIIEAHCEGREVECSVLGNEDPETSVPGEISTGADWYDFESKYEVGRMALVAPAPLSDELSARVRAIAAQTFKTLGCRGLARCDFFITADERVLVNEINTIPGFTETSVFAKLFEASGVSYPELCDRLVALAIERYTADRNHSF